MPTYFKPLRRKIGVITLVLACVFAIGWVRSFRVEDVETIVQTRRNTIILIASTQYGIVWSAIRVVDDVPVPKMPQFAWKSSPNQRFTLDGMLLAWSLCQLSGDRAPEISDDIVPNEDHLIVWHWTYGGFHFAQANWRTPPLACVATWIIPHWSIVVPLTLLSAWLLLSKPRAGKASESTQR